MLSSLYQIPLRDLWSDWLLATRHAGDPTYLQWVNGALKSIRDRVLDGARLSADSTMIDVGTGDGLIAFGAFERLGPSSRVFLTDISEAMLRHVEQEVAQRGFLSQCTFTKASAERLSGIEDSVADALTCRAVLAYVDDKRTAFREFFRVLKPGGRISIAEPIHRDNSLKIQKLAQYLEANHDIPEKEFLRLVHRWKAAQFPVGEQEIAQSPLVNFTERDLFEMAFDSGFTELHLELHIDVHPSSITNWEVFLNTSPHPWAPSLGEIMAGQFSPIERDLFEPKIRSCTAVLG